MKISGFDTDKNILIVAEIGNNHEGSYALAEKMVHLAAKAGAGAVKFQAIVPNKLVSIRQRKRIHQLEKFRLTNKELKSLSKVAKRENVLFLCTPFDIGSVQFLKPLVPAFKIASGDNNFFPLIDAIARTDKPIILSTGLADIKQIIKVKDFIQTIWRKSKIRQELALLHCVANYPVRPEEANLLAIRTLREQFGVTIGYSDHTLGIDAAVLSVALGARIIEKHFTIDKNFSDFHDHRISTDPKDFALLVERVKQTLKMLGNGKKCLQDSEKRIVNIARRSIVAKHDLNKGAILSLDDITWVRPGGGLPPGKEHLLIGKSLSKSIKRGELLVTEILSEKNHLC